MSAKKHTTRQADATQPKTTDGPDFERAMAELEETVRVLEGGDLPLEDSLAAFEKGVALVKALHGRLDAVQTRIDELTQGPDGAANLAALAPLAGRGAANADEDDEDDDE
jgi:exodeoxyribonuclease VII small subunit